MIDKVYTLSIINSMKKISEFLKTNFIIAKWTFWYFLVVWLILWYIFRFDMFARVYWWKFFHAHLRGFVGFTFGAFIYAIIPVYLATVSVIYRTKAPIIKIPLIDKLSEYIKNKFTKPEPEPVAAEEKQDEAISEIQYPEHMPNEMRSQFKRLKEHMIMLGTNGQKTMYQSLQKTNEPIIPEPEDESFPIPTDFDIGDTLNNSASDDNIPTFTEINFDEPSKPVQPDNTMIKYLRDNDIEFETYNDFIVTGKYLIYVHSDPDFWIIDEDNWFAAGKQIDSPIPVMQEMTKDEQLKPVIYFESTNIMDFDGTVETLRNQNITVIINPEELD